MLKNILSDLAGIFASRATWSVWRAYFNTLLLLRGRIRAGAAKADLREFRALTQAGTFQTNWFGGNVAHWLYVIDRYGLAGRNLDVLEIGSWEGASSLFILCALPAARLTCVDTWEGADEHRGTEALNAIERNFIVNTAAHAGRLTRFKGTSYAFFAAHDGARFDLIYIDGSHHADDVMIDAIKGFEALRVGGVMIFDDYLWRYYPRRADNPAAAINAFLRLKQGCYDMVLVNWQVVIRKTGGERQAG